MTHCFDTVIDRKESGCTKYHNAICPPDVLPMWIADTDFSVPREIIKALQQRISHPCFGYPFASMAFERAAQRWEKIRFAWDIEADWVKYSNGVLPFLVYAIRAFSLPGDNIIIQSPVYPPFYAIIKNNGRQVVTNPLRQDATGKYQIDFADLETRLSHPRSKILIISNPHNPVMRSYSYQELEKIGKLCIKYNVLVISDEIHCDIVFDKKKHIPFGSVSTAFAENSIVLINPSKTFNTAGFRTGAAIIADKNIRSDIESVIVNNKNYGRTIFGMCTFITAYTECDYYADELLSYLQDNRDYLLSFIKTRLPAIKISEPEATYLMWLDCRQLNLPAAELSAFFLQRAKLKLNEGETFGVEGAGFMRMNIACPRSVLAQALIRLETACRAMAGEG